MISAMSRGAFGDGVQSYAKVQNFTNIANDSNSNGYHRNDVNQ